MKTTYLLPCSCGRKVPIEPRQAGEAISCVCGQVLQAPTLLKMAALERAEPEEAPARPQTKWGWAQRVVLFGILLTAASLVAGLVVIDRRPYSPTENVDVEFLRSQVDRLSPGATIGFFRKTLETGLDATKFPAEKAYAEAMNRFWAWLSILAVSGGVGALMIAVGLWKSSRNARSTAAPKPPRN